MLGRRRVHDQNSVTREEELGSPCTARIPSVSLNRGTQRDDTDRGTITESNENIFKNNGRNIGESEERNITHQPMQQQSKKKIVEENPHKSNRGSQYGWNEGWKMMPIIMSKRELL